MSESAIKYLRQSNGGQRVDTRCCNYRCQQGRTCKVHQACEVPEPDEEDADGNRAFLYFVVPVIAVFVGWLLWPVVSYFLSENPMNNTPAETTALAMAPRQGFDLSPQSFEQALTFSNYLADSDLVPKDFKGKPGNCLIAVQWGAELGLKPMQAMQNLAIINGRPSLWGDAVLALVRASSLCEYVMETDDGHTATCRVKRRGDPAEQIRTFSMDDAKAARLELNAPQWGL